LVEIGTVRGWPKELIIATFGKSEHTRVSEYAAFTLSAASLSHEIKTAIVTRTSIGDHGVAADKSLRTTEFIAKGSVFTGRLFSASKSDSVEDLAWRLSLLSVFAIGSNRNRGTGSCVVDIKGESRGPGELLRKLDALLPSWLAGSKDSPTASSTSEIKLSSKAVVLRLTFRATTPICCPEIPDKSNVMATGFTIPASAVQGLILTEINRRQPALADALFAHPIFRAWPMQPCWQPMSRKSDTVGDLPVSAVRVSLTHRAAKYSIDKVYGVDDFHDEALEPKRSFEDQRPGSPLKASDGVLLRYSNGEVKLWRASDMPHVITTHGVHAEELSHDLKRERNLFTVDAMAPLVWQGLVVVPEDAVSSVLEVFSMLPQVSIGKSRTVRGLGSLEIERIEGVPAEWKTHTDKTVLVVQSPIPMQTSTQSADEIFRSLAENWAEKLNTNIEKVWTSSGILFGCNRVHQGRQPAQRVVLPGSVIEFKGKIDERLLMDFLTCGDCVPDGRQRGYGALSVHPGKATKLLEIGHAVPSMAASPDNFAEAVRLALKIARNHKLPSISQIRSVQQRVGRSVGESAIDYLDRQRKKTSNVWSDWDDCHADVRKLLTDFPKSAEKALEVLADLACVKEKSEVMS